MRINWRKMSESEVASYVLAYMLRQNYSQTARSFLNECSVLPSKSLVVLPQTPLETIIARHKSISDTRVLVSTLGESSAWGALWNKLDTTLQQIRCLSEELVANPSRGAVGGRSRGRRVTKTMGSSSLHTSPVISDLNQPITSVQGSPHRRKPVPKRKVLTRTPENVESAGEPTNSETPPSPTMQQVLDTFLGDNTLPGKLADIINQCVSSGPDVSSGELTSDTLDNILNMTCSEPALEGLFTTTHDHPPSDLDHVIPCKQQPSMNTEDHVTESGPAEKRQRLDDVPSEQDIDDFLDQLHKPS